MSFLSFADFSNESFCVNPSKLFEDFIQMRLLAVKLLAKQLDEEVDKWELEKGISEEMYEALSKSHFRRQSKHSE